jgi:hypothetical protein
MSSNPLVTFATAFALSAAPAWAQASRRVPPLMWPMMRLKMPPEVTIASAQRWPNFAKIPKSNWQQTWT